MMERKKPVRPIFNPYDDRTEQLLCEFDVHQIKGVISVEVKKIWSDEQIDLCEWLKESYLEKVEDDYRDYIESGNT